MNRDNFTFLVEIHYMQLNKTRIQFHRRQRLSPPFTCCFWNTRVGEKSETEGRLINLTQTVSS